MHIKFDGIANKMPGKKAPPEMVKILPALELPSQKTAAPTLKPKVARAILEELQARRKSHANSASQ